MEQFTLCQKTEISNENKAKNYLIRYLGELRRHFNLSEDEIKRLLLKSYLELYNKGVVKKWLSVLKSFLRLK